MGYTTYFEGKIEIVPPLNQQEIDYLTKFAETRRMDRARGPYFVGGEGFRGQGDDSDVRNSNQPDSSQPGLWCQWVPTTDGKFIEWDQNEKFYSAKEWMQYIIKHFIGEHPAAKAEVGALDFLQGHKCNGLITADGEDSDDHWQIEVVDNIVNIKTGEIVYS
jgi:hypothetical protein